MYDQFMMHGQKHIKLLPDVGLMNEGNV